MTLDKSCFLWSMLIAFGRCPLPWRKPAAAMFLLAFISSMFLFVLFETGSLCSPGYPGAYYVCIPGCSGTLYIDQAGLTHRAPLAACAWDCLLGLGAITTMPGLFFFNEILYENFQSILKSQKSFLPEGHIIKPLAGLWCTMWTKLTFASWVPGLKPWLGNQDFIGIFWSCINS